MYERRRRGFLDKSAGVSRGLTSSELLQFRRRHDNRDLTGLGNGCDEWARIAFCDSRNLPDRSYKHDCHFFALQICSSQLKDPRIRTCDGTQFEDPIVKPAILRQNDPPVVRNVKEPVLILRIRREVVVVHLNTDILLSQSICNNLSSQ
jgi:hypothetical protein